MSLAPERYRFSLEGFVRAWDAGVFDGARVELVDGEVLPVVIGPWHGDTTARVIRRLPEPPGFLVTGQSLATAGSLPDPDAWLRRTAPEPVARVGRRLWEWPAASVALVVEVADETVGYDLGVKARLYGRGGYERYWVVTPEGVHVHTGPHELGYQDRVLHEPGERVAWGYVDGDVAVDDLLAPRD